jgi:hypothetical protein
MSTVYLLAPGLRVEVSRDGVDFRPHKLRPQLQFPGPVETTETQMVFVEGERRVRANRADVIVSHQYGGYGWNEFGA